MIQMPDETTEFMRDYDRLRLRKGLVSLFWAVISDRRKRGRYTLKTVADALGKDKSAISRWFGLAPNWRLDTVADIASALDLDLEIQARDRVTGWCYESAGVIKTSGMTSAPPDGSRETLGDPRNSAWSSSANRFVA